MKSLELIFTFNSGLFYCNKQTINGTEFVEVRGKRHETNCNRAERGCRVMKAILGVIIYLITILPILTLARIAGLADRHLEEIQRKAAERETGDLNGD